VGTLSEQIVVRCGDHYDGMSAGLGGPIDLLVEDGTIIDMREQITAPAGAVVVDLRHRTVTPGFIDCHVHLTMDAAALPAQTLQSSAQKVLAGLAQARAYMQYGFTTLRDLGSADPEWPVVDLRRAIDAGLVEGPRLFVAAHFVSATGSHGDINNFYNERWALPVSQTADSIGAIRRLVRREHRGGSDWIKTTNAGGYHSASDDPKQLTWFDDEMDAVCATATQLGLPVAVHTGAAEACRQAIRSGVRSLEHAYLIDDDGITMAEAAGTFVVPTMQLTVADSTALQSGALPNFARVKFARDVESIRRSQRRLAASTVKIAFGTDAGMFPFAQGILEFQAMTAAGLEPVRALRSAMSVAAELLDCPAIGSLAVGQAADLAAMPGDPTTDISATAAVDWVMRAGKVVRAE
jgi:imidazolonepropionase-like amidohydrolase